MQATSCSRALCVDGAYCHNCDLLVGLEGLHLTRRMSKATTGEGRTLYGSREAQ